MPLNTHPLGSGESLHIVLGDPAASGSKQSVLTVTDARALAGLFAALVQGVPLLLNATGNHDEQRSAVGTTGIPVVNTEGTKITYSVGTLAFTPAATATDFWRLLGSATKTARLTRLTITGFATAAISIPISLIKRTTANTGGTEVSLASTTGIHDSNDGAQTCVVTKYSVEPTGLGTNGGLLRAEYLNLGVTGAAGRIEWTFGNRNSKTDVLRGVAQSYVLNWNGAAVPAGTVLTIDCEWTEES